MFKKILVPTDGSEYSLRAIQSALEIAKKYDSTVYGLHVIDVKLLEGPFLRDLSASLGIVPYTNYQASIRMILEEKGRAALDAFQEECNRIGIKCETSLVTGMLSKAISDAGNLSDLIVMGQRGENAPWGDVLLGSTVEAVVRRTIKPVLVTPSTFRSLKRILVGYDGSEYAKHALGVAAAIAREWNAQVRVITVHVDAVQGDKILGQARDYLKTQDIEFQGTVLSGSPDIEIRKEAQKYEADLIVMGAYGHSKVREFIVGSTTARVMRRATCPVLLSR